LPTAAKCYPNKTKERVHLRVQASTTYRKTLKLNAPNLSIPKRKIFGRQVEEDSEKERKFQKIRFRIETALREAIQARLTVYRINLRNCSSLLYQLYKSLRVPQSRSERVRKPIAFNRIQSLKNTVNIKSIHRPSSDKCL